MFKLHQNTSVYMYKYNSDFCRWEPVYRFDSEDELVDYLSSRMETSFDVDYNGFVHDGPLKSTLDINYSGTDTRLLRDTEGKAEYVLRSVLFIDGGGRIVDVRRLDEKVLERFDREQKGKAPDSWWWRRKPWQRPARRKMPLPAWKFRHDPVPFIGKPRGRYGRTVRGWFGSYRKDRIPEYRQYVRKKAMVPDIYDTEPTEQAERCWKSQGRRRHQWQKSRTRKEEYGEF